MESKNKLTKHLNSDLELKNINDLVSYEASIKLEDCLHAVPMLGMDKKYRPIIKANIDLALNAVALAHSIELSSDQASLLTNDLFEKYKTDSYQDIILCLKEMRQGVNGKLFGRLDMGMIGEAMRIHLDKKYQLKEAGLAGYKSGDNVHRTPQPRSLKQIAQNVGGNFSESSWIKNT